MNREKKYLAITVIMGLVLLCYVGFYCYYAFMNNFFFSFANLLTYLPSMLGIGGLIVFYSSGYKKSGLLRWFMCVDIFSFPFTVWYFSYYFTNKVSYTGFEPKLSVTIVVSMFLTLVLAVCSCIGLWLLSKEQLPKISHIRYGDEVVAQFDPAGGGLRFANRLIDTAVMLFIVLRNLSIYNFFGDIFRGDSYLGFLLIEIPAIIVYYFLLEGIFNTTAGKCATNTIIVNENGERPGFGAIAARTFCRLIPLEAFSFLGNNARGWHDTLSGTWVTAAMHKDELALNEITLDAELNPEAI